MNKSITGRHFELTDTIKAYADAAVEGLSKYNLDIISANTVISANEKNGKKGFELEFIVNLKDKNTIVISQKDKDVYAAIDLAIERVKKALRRHADKIKSHHVMSFKDLGLEAEAVTSMDTDEIEIVPMELELHKPLDLQEAIDALKEETKRQFIVFNDNEGIMKVMYKKPIEGSDEVEIVPMEPEADKLLNLEEAIDTLKEETQRQFIVFNDQSEIMRVMYKRADSKFGLY
jgi:putative sigma-54 modulation protein